MRVAWSGFAHLVPSPPTLKTSRAHHLFQLMRRWPSVMFRASQPDRVLVAGEALLTGKGRLKICTRPTYVRRAASLARLEPTAVLDDPVLPTLLADLGLDWDDEIDLLVTQTDTIIFFGHHRDQAAAAHLSTSVMRDLPLQRSAENLLLLRDAIQLPPRIRRCVPRLLRSGRVRGRTALLQTRACGHVYRPDWKRLELLKIHLDTALGALNGLQESILPPANNPSDNRLALLPSIFPQYASVLEQGLAVVEKKLGPPLPGMIHGDYGFHNLLYASPDEISGIVDWDRLRLQGYRDYDAMHLLMTAADPGGLCLADEFLIGIWLPARRHPLLDSLLRHFLNQTGIAEERAKHLALLLWLELAYAGGASAPRAWRERVIGRPAAALADLSWMCKPAR